jgi:hypothetical protein
MGDTTHDTIRQAKGGLQNKFNFVSDAELHRAMHEAVQRSSLLTARDIRQAVEDPVIAKPPRMSQEQFDKSATVFELTDPVTHAKSWDSREEPITRDELLKGTTSGMITAVYKNAPGGDVDIPDSLKVKPKTRSRDPKAYGPN